MRDQFRIICAALLSAAFVILTACGSQNENSAGQTADAGSTSVSIAETEDTGTYAAENGEQGAGQSQTERTDVVPDMEIQTDYGTLFYPEQWRELLQIEQSAGSDSVSVSFETAINDKVYTLFTVTIGGDGENPAGQLTDADGTVRNVFFSADELQLEDGLSESEQNRLYAMQEDINYVIEHLN